MYYIVVGADYTHPIGFVSPKKYHNYAPAINSLEIDLLQKFKVFFILDFVLWKLKIETVTKIKDSKD